ncbi:recombinase family protein [Brevibacillus porteri]|uniref:Recombinase family protein n=1 Tax=Brevibacillus porteri TaxID=2126350 RepID=A0ABX5FUJ8_9BACL|nr:recombinase family protein [Brevibacillus porteri]MED1801315.1 recombinase family protein [Brevibacillus porteri]MED2135022.1 recombinase family protein [Brevibacillus porteri]MED2745119.1 recombinase family protein [Brevibacillus porteri]MED2813412.1 recombinase family protein [Brevibacillus porteri]MED2897991.1 recombinase family protein [Brevibacillus porteri]
MDRVCMYLRKSRADLEAEARGEGETLAKHKKALLKLAKQHELNIIKIREEIVSGESLIHRPEMLELLKEVESKAYDAVLVMDIDRLGRGDKVDQGLIERAFRESGTKIITPRKIYDPNDEWDEEYMEFESFMARRELKLINRRLQRGRIASVEEGNYIATRPPYGYQIHKTDRERILIPHPEQARIVKMVFDWYTHEVPSSRMGSNKIAQTLNSMGYYSYTGKAWSSSSVLAILKNAVYVGRLQWKKKEEKKSTEPGKRKDVRTRPRSEWVDVQGKHEPLVTIETFQKAQDILGRKYHVPYQLVNGITNPLAGLVKCDMCGSSMVLRPYTKQQAHLKCYNQLCQNKSSRFNYVEQAVVLGLRDWLNQYKADWERHEQPSQNNGILETKRHTISILERELKDLDSQKGRLYDFLERGIYDEDTFLERSKNLSDRMEAIRSAINQAEQELELECKRQQAQLEIIPKVENVLELYEQTEDPAKKNSLLKTVIGKAVYRKEKWQREKNFELTLYPLIPQ